MVQNATFKGKLVYSKSPITFSGFLTSCSSIYCQLKAVKKIGGHRPHFFPGTTFPRALLTWKSMGKSLKFDIMENLVHKKF